jgi:hypothetical protein
MRPRRRRCGAFRTNRSCQSARAMGRRCFFPGPCCGNKHVQDFEYEYSSTSLDGRSRAFTLLARMTSRIAEAASAMMPRIPRVECEPQLVDAAFVGRDRSVTKVQTEQVHVRQRKLLVAMRVPPAGFAGDVSSRPPPRQAAAYPVVDRPARDSQSCSDRTLGKPAAVEGKSRADL